MAKRVKQRARCAGAVHCKITVAFVAFSVLRSERALPLGNQRGLTGY